MSTPIKPPDGPASGVGDPVEGAEADRIDGSDSGPEFQREVTGAGAVRGEAADPSISAISPRVETLSAEVEAGRVSPDAAIEQLVQRALETARGLPEAERQALETQLRSALAEDPTLMALRKDLVRAAKA